MTIEPKVGQVWRYGIPHQTGIRNDKRDFKFQVVSIDPAARWPVRCRALDDGGEASYGPAGREWTWGMNLVGLATLVSQPGAVQGPIGSLVVAGIRDPVEGVSERRPAYQVGQVWRGNLTGNEIELQTLNNGTGHPGGIYLRGDWAGRRTAIGPNDTFVRHQVEPTKSSLTYSPAGQTQSGATILIAGPPRPPSEVLLSLQHDFSNPYLLNRRPGPGYVGLRLPLCVACGINQGKALGNPPGYPCRPVPGWREAQEAALGGKAQLKSKVLPYRALDPLGAIVGDGRLMGLAIKRRS